MKKSRRLIILNQLLDDLGNDNLGVEAINKEGLKEIINYYSTPKMKVDESDEKQLDSNINETVITQSKDVEITDGIEMQWNGTLNNPSDETIEKIDTNDGFNSENPNKEFDQSEDTLLETADPKSSSPHKENEYVRSNNEEDLMENKKDSANLASPNDTDDLPKGTDKISPPVNNESPNLANLINLPKGEKKVQAPKSMKYQAKNGQVGVFYSLSLTELPIGDEIIIEEIDGLEEKGLKYSKINSEISGYPKEAGEFEFPLTFRFEGSSFENRPSLSKALKILINPDPKSLWQVNEPPLDSLYRKPHFDFKSHKFNEYGIYGASIRGRSHAHAATHRDDDFLISEISTNVLLTIVADGAGSASYSREGSRFVCDACLKSIEGNTEKLFELEELLKNRDEERNNQLSTLAYNMIGDAVKKSYLGLTEKAKENNHVLKDYSTTLLLTLIVKAENEYCIISYGLGDGIASIINNDKPMLLTTPDSGQHAGQTRFITMGDTLQTIHKRLKINFTSSLKNTFLMTDGISDVFFETDSRLSEMSDWQKLIDSMDAGISFQGEEIETEFKEWINFFSKGNHDDRTIIWIR